MASALDGVAPRGTENRIGRLTPRTAIRLALRGTALAAIAIALWFVVRNVHDNLAARGLSLGFGFLWQEAGFGISFHLIDYSEASSYGRAFLVGLTNTILVAAAGIVGATLIGFAVGILRLSPNWAVSRLALMYVELVRNLPLLLHILIWHVAVMRSLPPVRASLSIFDVAYLSNRGVYLPAPVLEPAFAPFALALLGSLVIWLSALVWVRRWAPDIRRAAIVHRWALAVAILLPAAAVMTAGPPIVLELPVLSGFDFRGGISLPPELAALVAALALYNAAYIAEIVRCSIEAVSRGQREASTALGLSRLQTMRLIVLPQAMRVAIPPLTNQYNHLIKASSLATAIGFPDLVSVFAGTTLNQTGRAIEIMSLTMAVFLAINLAIAGAMSAYNRHMALRER